MANDGLPRSTAQRRAPSSVEGSLWSSSFIGGSPVVIPSRRGAVASAREISGGVLRVLALCALFSAARGCGSGGGACGDGLMDLGEGCGDGAQNSDACPDACRTPCQPASCGDGFRDTGEACDDGNNESGDGCRADCLGLEDCGDGLLDPG